MLLLITAIQKFWLKQVVKISKKIINFVRAPGFFSVTSLLWRRCGKGSVTPYSSYNQE